MGSRRPRRAARPGPRASHPTPRELGRARRVAYGMRGSRALRSAAVFRPFLSALCCVAPGGCATAPARRRDRACVGGVVTPGYAWPILTTPSAFGGVLSCLEAMSPWTKALASGSAGIEKALGMIRHFDAPLVIAWEPGSRSCVARWRADAVAAARAWAMLPGEEKLVDTAIAERQTMLTHRQG